MTGIRRRTVLGTAAGAAALSAVPLGTAGTARADEGQGIRPVALTTEHLADPLGIDVAAPRLGWRLEAAGQGRRQTAYRIVVAGSRESAARGRGDVWDSGRVESPEQSARKYAGPPLKSRTRYFWAVQAWDESGRPGPWSEVARFETAMLAEKDWAGARWIGSGVEIPKPTRTLSPMRFTAAELKTGHTLGQTFATAGPLAAVAVYLTGDDERPGGCTMTLRREGPTGEVIGHRTVSGIGGETQGRLDLDAPADPGTYYVELSTPSGTVEWQSVADDVYPDGTAYTDGKAVPGDRWVYGLPPDPPADPLLRREFEVPGRVVSARLYLVGLGHAVAWVNGKRVGDAVLSPAATDYDIRALYTAHDITDHVREGRNALGIALGRGFFATREADSDGSNLARWIAEPRLRARLEVRLEGGRTVTVGSDAEWSLTEGPTTYDGVYTGESYDARRAQRLAGWTEPGFAAEGWRTAKVVKGPGGRLQAYAVEPIRAHEPVKPVAVSQPADGVRLFDFGEVVAGWVRLHGRLPVGTTVRISYGEKLSPEGRIDHGPPGGINNPSVVGRFQVDGFTAAGSGTETWEPSFTYKGFRYAEVSGTDSPLEIVAVPVYSDVPDTMDIELDQPVLQWIADAFTRTARNGLHGHPDITPFSKMGWLGANHLSAQPMLYRFGMAGVYAKWLDDIRLGQADSGELPMVAPQGTVAGGAVQVPTYTGVYPYLVRRYWLMYGDRTVPEKHFEAVARYLAWQLGQLEDGLADDQFGDWYAPGRIQDPRGPEGSQLVATAAVIHALREATELAELLGRDQQARAWRMRTRQLVRRFNSAFLDTSAGVYRTDVPAGYRQTSNAVPLAMGLVPEKNVAEIAAHLAADVEAKDRHLNTGSIGTATLPYALTDHGHAGLALAALAQETYPGYGYWRSLGATTFWENWERTARAHNDSTLSSPVSWLVERVLGVEPVEPGWARFKVAPKAFGDLPGARLALDTVRGRIEAAWTRRDDGIELRVRVPVNAVAEVTLPGERMRELGSGTHRLTSAR
ncbi:glycoside hydrolase family 78 protein [Streptomyces pseudoechinosporeus]